ncbi:MAG TPA: RNA polymerase sigma factor [Solirubrobacteraceae bacterium]
MPDTNDDAEILARSLDDPAEFAAIYTRHVASILRYARRRLGETAGEDAATEVFVRAFNQRATFTARHPTALPWLYWLAGQVIGDHARAQRRRLKLLARLAETVAPASTDSAGVRPGLDPEVVRGLRRLSEADRETLLLVVWGELTYEEAAAALGVPVGTVRSRISRARLQLRRDIPEPANATNRQTGEAHA